MNNPMNAQYPDSRIRREYLDTYYDPDSRRDAHAGMLFILGECDKYLFKQYHLRDKAVALLKENKVEDAMWYLNEIGRIGS